MSDFATAVVAVDDSALAADAAALANALARPQHGGRVFGVHVAPDVDPTLSAALFPFANLGDDHDEIRAHIDAQATQRAARRVHKLLHADKIRATHGPFATAFMHSARELGATLLVLPAEPHTADGALREGTRAVVAHAHVPVVIARGGDRAHAVPTRILAPVDLTDEAGAVIVAALELAHALGGQVQPLFVAATPTDVDPANVVAVPPPAGGIGKKQITQRWAQIEAALTLPYPITSQAQTLLRPKVITMGDPATKIVDIAAETDTQLIVMARGRAVTQRLGRVAEHVARHARCHVMLLPPPDDAAR